MNSQINSRLNKFHGNISAWIESADMRIDYFTQFTKAWIAFNAWFSSSYPHEISDSTILNKIKKEVNPLRSKLIFYLNTPDEESLKLRSHVANLHTELEKNQIPSIERKITFTNILLEKNTLPSKEEVLRGKNYSFKVRVTYNHGADPGAQKIITEVFDLREPNISARMNFNQNDWDVEELRKHPQFKLPRLSDSRIRKKVQDKIIYCYSEVNPSKPTNLILDAKGKESARRKPDNCIVMDLKAHVYFIPDENKIVSGIISILYDLRNKLFHGEINPSPEVQKIYKEAYYILYTLLKVL